MLAVISLVVMVTEHVGMGNPSLAQSINDYCRDRESDDMRLVSIVPVPNGACTRVLLHFEKANAQVWGPSWKPGKLTSKEPVWD